MTISLETRRTFQVLNLVAVVMVVAIHYRSAESDIGSFNYIFQEFFCNGIARTAVPLFALMSGFFFFQGDDGSLALYWHKVRSRIKSILLPYLLVATIFFIVWAAARIVADEKLWLTWRNFIIPWLLWPKSVQLWYLRDLIVLVAVAPAIYWLARMQGWIYIVMLIGFWFFEQQPFPIVGGWYLLNIETLAWFSLGGWLSLHHFDFRMIIQMHNKWLITLLWGLWAICILGRYLLYPTFDIWYETEYTVPSLLLQKVSIIIGCLLVIHLSGRLAHPKAIHLSGFSFFVFLFHFFPLNEAIYTLMRMSQLPQDLWFFIMFPLAVTSVLGAAYLCYRWLPALYALLTGSRGPEQILARIGSI